MSLVPGVLEARLSKSYRLGTHRSLSPDSLLQRLLPRLGDFGITRLAGLTGLDRIGLPVFAAIRPTSKSIVVSQGKGIDSDAARASALMESIELAAAEDINAPLRFATWDGMEGLGRALRPGDLTLRPSVEPPEDARLLWIEGTGLRTGDPVFVPFDLVSMDTTLPSFGAGDRFLATTNGLASGCHMLEALCHGLAEVIERDATARWFSAYREERAARRLDLDSITGAAPRALLSRFSKASVDPLVWSTVGPTGIPSFLCMLVGDAPGAGPTAALGAGCHPSREIALLRSLTEAAQSRLTMIAGSRDDIFQESYEWERYSSTEIEAFRALEPRRGTRIQYAEIPDFENDGFELDLRQLLQGIARAGFAEPVAIELTGYVPWVAVAKVVVPGALPPGHGSPR